MSPALRISIGANIVLTGSVAVLLLLNSPATTPSVAPPEGAASVSPNTQRPDGEIKEPRPKSTGIELTPTTLAQLEQIGISRGLLVSALLENSHRAWDRRFAELQKKYAPKQVPERQYVELARLRDAEQIRELKEALGEEGYLAWDKEQTLRVLNNADLPLSAEEAEQAYRLQKEFDQNNKEMQMAMEDGVMDMADAGALHTQAQETLDRELEKLLGKKRLDEMRGYSDPIAEVYRMFGDVNPTPDQAQAVVLAEENHRAREEDLTRRLNEDPGQATNLVAELEAMSGAREENLRRIFGAEAYDDIKRRNDPTYKTLQQYAGAWELNERQISSVYETLHPFQDQANRMRIAAEFSEAAGQRVNWREIDSAIEQAQRKTETALLSLIGDERLRRLKQNGVLTGR